jgi:hypothetical protein
VAERRGVPAHEAGPLLDVRLSPDIPATAPSRELSSKTARWGIGVRIALARPAVAWSHRRATSASARYSTPGQIHKLYGQVVASYLKNTHLEEGISGGPG